MPTLYQALVIASILVGVVEAQHGNAAIRCNDVTKLDVKNLTIRTGQQTFVFHNGTAVLFDSSPELDPEITQPDWQAEIKKDRIIRPAANVVVRFFLISASHLTGSGNQEYATAFRCSGGKLQEVFHRDGLTLSVDRLDATAISVSLNVTADKPIRKHWSYVWDRDKSKYVLSSRWIGNVWLSAPMH